MTVLFLMLTACAPQDATVSGTYHAWLAKNSSATVAERELSLEDAAILDCSDPASERVEGSTCTYRTPNPVNSRFDEPDYENFRWMDDDAYYVLQGELVPWRSEAIMTSEGDFLVTVHHDLGDGQDFRFAFVIKPDYQPTVCIQEGQTCYTGVDNDGDGWVDAEDPDCLYGAWEIGYYGSWSPGTAPVACNDGIDNDGDGSMDAGDSDCLSAFGTSEGGDDPTCIDDSDNDGDGWTDNDDPDCEIFGVEDGASNDALACSNGLDDDGDGLADALDGGCSSARDNLEDGPTDDNPCRDEWDGDGDGWTDANDPDCTAYATEVGFGSTACNDGADGDGDGLIDAEDPGCLTATDVNEQDMDSSCTDNLDNDTDGFQDENDPDCYFGTGEIAGSWAFTTECNDGIDNDGDGNIDGSDRQCNNAFDTAEAPTGSATCRDTDLADEDNDGWVNTEDPDCAGGSNEVGLSTLPCNDGVDNDNDGLADMDDPDCVSAWRTTEDALDAGTDCNDGVDNDADGWTDGHDEGCLIGSFEASSVGAECSDNVDNDGDGLADALDPDCKSALDLRELTDDGCADGIDNDGDGWIDSIDPDCASLGFEQGFVSGYCADGVDNDGDGLVDGLDDGCANPNDAYEQEIDECADGLDNDSDGWKDDYDPDCLGGGVVESGELAVAACNNGSDDDADGLVDALDPDCRSAQDNVEANEPVGEPVAVNLDYGSTLENWSADEDGYTIYYLNAGAYQLNPADSEDYWILPQEWLGGYANSKFAAEEFDSLPTDFYWLGFDANNPDPDGYAEAVEGYRALASAWEVEPATYGLMDPPDFTMKVEGNEWRPIDLSAAGLDNWVEVNTSYVRIKDGSTLEEGGTATGDFQIFLVGREAGSKVIVNGTFDVPKIGRDRWGYGVLEDEKRAELADEGYDVVVCE